MELQPTPENLKGPFIVWVNYGCEGWQPTSFQDLKTAIEASKYTDDWIVTRAVEYEVQEKVCT